MSNLGLFVLSVAGSHEKTLKVPDDQAIEIHENLTNQIISKIDQIRNAQRRDEDESLNVTTF